jgi:hypothetical protein
MDYVSDCSPTQTTYHRQQRRCEIYIRDNKIEHLFVMPDGQILTRFEVLQMLPGLQFFFFFAVTLCIAFIW